MKYILMMNAPRNAFESFGAWPQEAIRKHIAFMKDLNQQLKAEGVFVAAEGLDDPRKAKLVRAGKNRMPVTDGPFAETKEFLVGYWIVQVESEEQAYEIAARASAAPAPDGQPMNMPIEVRQVMSGPPEEFV